MYYQKQSLINFILFYYLKNKSIKLIFKFKTANRQIINCRYSVFPKCCLKINNRSQPKYCKRVIRRIALTLFSIKCVFLDIKYYL